MADQTEHISRLDLNLLTSLNALLAEKSVTGAARRLYLSQPALSASLARLRVHFSDPILMREGNHYQLTPLAVRLSEQTGAALEAARRVFAAQAEWDPSESTREFSIAGSDHGLYVFGPVIAELAAQRAPHVRFRFVHHSPALVDDAANALRSIDGMLLPHGHVADLPFIDLSPDQWRVLVAEDNPLIGETLTMEDVAMSPWVFTYQSQSAFTSAGRQIQQLGIEPHVECVVEGFMVLPAFVAGTRRLALLQGHLAEYALALGGVRVLDPPFDATPLRNAFWWHPVHRSDPEHSWMRDLVAEAGRVVEERDDVAESL
jgi:LysR family transcriptional regulator, nod-box dependent transcriptional activator